MRFPPARWDPVKKLLSVWPVADEFSESAPPSAHVPPEILAVDPHARSSVAAPAETLTISYQFVVQLVPALMRIMFPTSVGTKV
jgi:hypothetical protein